MSDRLYVDLDNVARIVNRVFATLGRNPELLNGLLATVDNAVGQVGGVANTALQPGGVASQAVGTVGRTLNTLVQPGGVLSQTVNQLGQTVQTTLGPTGDLVERTLNAAGQATATRTVGNLLRLPVLNEVAGQGGNLVRQVTTAAGTRVEYTVDRAGKLLNARVLR
ncbi:MAG TPA: hypothetical protein VF035_07055 [Longimicrobiales bacterium]